MGCGQGKHFPGSYYATVRYPNEKDCPARATPVARTRPGPWPCSYFYVDMGTTLEIPYDVNQQHVVVTVWSENGACGDVVIPLWDRGCAGMAERSFAGPSDERLPTATLEVIFPADSHVAAG